MHFKKHLSFTAIRSMIAGNLAKIKDTRAANNINSLVDVMLSGLACMYFQSDSLMEFQRNMERREQRNNLRSMFTVKDLPMDQGMRNVIDEVETETAFRPIFKELFSKLQRGKHLERYQTLPGKYLLNVDGTQYYSSDKVSCKHCLVRGQKTQQYNCHQVLQGAIVKTGLRQVIPVMPEEISVQDGDNKDDCESNAFKRFLTKFRKDHDKLEIIINADALYATTPIIKLIHQHKANYIFKIKVANHKTLMNNMNATSKSRITIPSLRKNNLIIEWVNNVELFTSTKIKSNYLEAWEVVPQKDGSNKSEYYGKWITDLESTPDNVKIILDAARALWKIENECFNSLKNHGYNIEHNYGHSSNHLCYNFYNFTLLAFPMHQIHQLTDKLFQEMRATVGRLGSLWEKIRTAVELLFFPSMEILWEYIALKRDYHPPPV